MFIGCQVQGKKFSFRFIGGQNKSFYQGIQQALGDYGYIDSQEGRPYATAQTIIENDDGTVDIVLSSEPPKEQIEIIESFANQQAAVISL